VCSKFLPSETKIVKREDEKLEKIDTKVLLLSETFVHDFIPKHELKLKEKMHKIKFETVYFNGVHGHNWVPTLAENRLYTQIASPLPKVEEKRILANDLPDRTLSETSFDIPKRRDVVQVTLPTSRRKVIETLRDPRNLMKPVPVSHERINVIPEWERFMQVIPEHAEAVEHAKHAEHKADHLIESITRNIERDNKMSIPIITLNKSEEPSLIVHHPEDNHGLKERLKELKELGVHKTQKWVRHRV